MDNNTTFVGRLSLVCQPNVLNHIQTQCPSPDGMIMGNHDDIIWSSVKSGDISWNFEKFLIDHHGKPVHRLPSVNSKEQIWKADRKLPIRDGNSSGGLFLGLLDNHYHHNYHHIHDHHIHRD
ncbi:epididymal secretory glutathione peroxidase-like [Nematostella vectensis]|uniref:epididymal secretory glutathione peroxidase-like n=1 Tax=Nematostella vectensis TaxID=45351 RepID=UPI0020776020|nr:epididymal secretory glutathione peroxidase-like [Nematostella vectensis]